MASRQSFEIGRNRCDHENEALVELSIIRSSMHIWRTVQELAEIWVGRWLRGILLLLISLKC